MLIKTADDQSALLADLERQVAISGPNAKRAAEELRNRRAGLKGEAESAYFIDFEFASARNWAVIHDLRIEHEGRVAQIDHLLVNRWMDFYVLESKHFHAGLKITDDGEFLRWNNFQKKYEGMPSPLMQNDRHIQVLRDVLSRIELPVRLGMRITPTFQTFILVAPSARIDRPKRFDASRVIKADQLKERIWKDIDDANVLQVAVSVAKVVSRETMEFVARQLVDLHKPLARQLAAPVTTPSKVSAPKSERSASPATAIADASEGPTCKACATKSGEILYGRYGYYFKCRSCEANTSIRFECATGHAPKLRKQGASFFRDCAQCGTSALYFQNP